MKMVGGQCGLGGKIGVIRIAVEMNTKFPEDVTEWKDIDGKEERI